MMIVLDAVLASEDVARVHERLAEAPWVDGRKTAGAAARAVKSNQQVQGGTPAHAELQAFITAALERHPVFQAAARPNRLSPILLSRYEPGMAYGRHTDDALMGPSDARFRTDLAFTMFLSDPATYEGGALVVHGPLGAQTVKLDAGQALLYPAGTIHEVEPVRAGVRLAAVGWVESLVRGAAEREILFDLDRARAAVGPEERLLLDKAFANLLRMWAQT